MSDGFVRGEKGGFSGSRGMLGWVFLSLGGGRR